MQKSLWLKSYITPDSKFLINKILGCYSAIRPISEAEKNIHVTFLKKHAERLEGNEQALILFTADLLNNQSNEPHEKNVQKYISLASWHLLNNDFDGIIHEVFKKGAICYLQWHDQFLPEEKETSYLKWKTSFDPAETNIVRCEEYEKDRRYYSVTVRSKAQVWEKYWLLAVGPGSIPWSGN